MRSNRSMPEARIIPELAYPDVTAAADWLCTAFGFSIRLRIADHRIQLALGAGALILRTGKVAPESCSSHSVMLRVENIDEHHASRHRTVDFAESRSTIRRGTSAIGRSDCRHSL